MATDRRRVALLLVGCLGLCLPATARAQVPQGWVPLPADRTASALDMVKAWTPGAAHAGLAALAGEWTFTSRLWVAPGADPEVSSGTTSAVTRFGGRYLQVTMRGTLTGLAYEGFGLRAYDNTSGQYQSVWMDNLSTTLLYMTGTYDVAARAYTLEGDLADFVDPSKRVRVREVLTVIDADTYRVELYETRGASTFRRLEFLHARTR